MSMRFEKNSQKFVNNVETRIEETIEFFCRITNITLCMEIKTNSIVFFVVIVVVVVFIVLLLLLLL